MINLVNDLYLDADKLQFILKKKGINKDSKSKNYGKETIKIIGYYPNMSQLLKSSVMNALREEDYNSLQEMEKELKRLSKVCEANINRIDFNKLVKAIK